MDNSPELPLRIRNLKHAAGPFALLFIMAVLLTGLAGILIAEELNTQGKEPNWVWIAVMGVGATIACVAFVYGALTTPVLWIELGDQITYRTPIKQHSRDWSEVASLQFDYEKVGTAIAGVRVTLGSNRVLQITLNDKKELVVMVTSEQEQIINGLWAKHRGTVS
jgi:hypothetical protein